MGIQEVFPTGLDKFLCFILLLNIGDHLTEQFAQLNRNSISNLLVLPGNCSLEPKLIGKIVVLRGYDEKEKNGEKDIEEPMFGRELRKHFQQNVFTDELVAELQNIVDITTIIDPKKLK